MYFLSRKSGFILSYKTEADAPSHPSSSLLLPLPIEARAGCWPCRSIKHGCRGDMASNWLGDPRRLRRGPAYCGVPVCRLLGLSEMPFGKGALDQVLDAVLTCVKLLI